MNQGPLYSDVSVVVPALNEARSILVLLQGLKDALPGAEIIVVDNGSWDGTSDVVRRSGLATRLVLEALPGKGNAMRAGAKLATRELLVFHDADLEYEPADAARMVALLRRDPGAMVTGVRSISIGTPSWGSLLAAAAVRTVLRLRRGTHLLDGADVLCGTRALGTAIFRSLGTRQPGFCIETEITRLALLRGMRLLNVPTSYRPRSRTEGKKIRPMHLWAILLEALR